MLAVPPYGCASPAGLPPLATALKVRHRVNEALYKKLKDHNDNEYLKS